MGLSWIRIGLLSMALMLAQFGSYAHAISHVSAHSDEQDHSDEDVCELCLLHAQGDFLHVVIVPITPPYCDGDATSPTLQSRSGSFAGPYHSRAPPCLTFIFLS